MADTLYLAPASATGVVLWDFTDDAGATNPEAMTSKLRVWDPGFPHKAPTLSGTTGTPGQTIVTRDDMPPVEGLVVTKVTAPSRDAYEAALAALGQVLERSDLVIVRRFTGETVTRYYSLVSADFDAPVGDAGGMDLVLTRNTQIELSVSFIRRTSVATDVLDPDVQKATNPTLLYIDAAGAPLGWVLTKGTGNTYAQPNPDRDCFEVDNGSASVASTIVQDIPATPGQTWSAAVDAWDWGTTVKSHMVYEFLNAAKSSTLYGPISVDAGAVDFGPTTQRRAASRISHSHTAPASTAWLRITLKSDIGGRSRWRFLQAELAAAPTAFRMGPQTWTNDPSDATQQGRSILAYNPGRTKVAAAIKSTAGASAAIVVSGYALRSSIHLPESTTTYLNRAQLATLINRAGYFAAIAGTLSNTTSIQASTGASGGSAAETAYASASGPDPMARRVRMVTTDPAQLAALRGRFMAWLRVRPQTSGAAHRIKVRYAAGNIQPATQDVGIVVRDWTGAPALNWVGIPMGVIDLPLSGVLGGLSIELYSQRLSGSGRLRWDFVHLTPADSSAGELWVPGSTPGATYAATDFIVPPVVVALSDPTFAPFTMSRDETFVALNAQDEGFATPAIAPASGHHRVRFYTAKQNPWTGTAIFRVVNVTDGTIAASKAVAATFQPYVELQYDSVSGKSYQYEGYLSNYTSGALRASKVTDTFDPVVAASESLWADAARYEALKLDTSGAISYRAGVRGALPMMLPPGLSVITRRVAETGLTGFQDPVSPLSRTMTDRLYVAPAYLT